MTERKRATCHHCGVEFSWKPFAEATGDGTVLPFCCRGCQAAFHLISAAGLGSFYARGDRDLPTVSEKDRPEFRDDDLNRHVIPEAAGSRLDILVGGISCPSCVWLLERMIGRTPGVSRVSISYAGGVATVLFDPGVAGPADIYNVIASLGFLPRPYSPDLSTREALRERNDLLLRFGTALFLTMQLMAYSYSLYAGYFQGISPGIKAVLQYASFVVATPVVFYCGWPFLAGAGKSLRSLAPGMDLLIAVGSLTAWVYSVWALLSGRETYFESAAMIVTFILVGRLLELSVRRTAMSGIESLYAAAVQRATVVDENLHHEIPVDEVQAGYRLLVRQGERFPVDCLLLDGDTEIDQALVTGESAPVLVLRGAEVRAGCINIAAPVVVEALRPVGQSYLMRVAALVHMAQAGKPSLQRLADRIAGWFVPVVILLAVVVCAGHYLMAGEGLGAALMVSLSVVLIACPCAMGLAVPAAVLAAGSRAASLGIILRGGDVIERLAAVDSVYFDKTGTITAGTPRVSGFIVTGSMTEADVLTAVASVEQFAAHPLAKALVSLAADNGILPEPCRNFRVIPGKGVYGELADGRPVLCGSRTLLDEHGVPVPELPLQGGTADTVVLLSVNGSAAGVFTLADRIRTGAGSTVAVMKRYGLDLRLVSGDAQTVVDRIAAETGIGIAHGGMTPDQKLDLVREAQGQGRKVLMAGDGVNDAPALAAADVSCSLTGSSDIALENADIIIAADDLARLATAYRIARRSMTIIRQNLAWAFVYNIVGIPLAVSGALSPVYAAVAMTASSLLVSLNSLRLMRIQHHG